MDRFVSLFIGNPKHILTVAFVFLAAYLLLRFTQTGKTRHPGSLLIASSAWGVYAAWEWLVHTKTPEANIRVDLLVIFPVLLIISAWGLIRLFR